MEDTIRGIVNSDDFWNRYFSQHRDDWNLLCVCMDTIGDTTLAIQNFLDEGVGKTDREQILDGKKYLRIYGLFQAIYMQQDSIRFLYKIFKNCFKTSANLKEFDHNPKSYSLLRKYRNLVIGHPTDYRKNSKDKEKITSIISRPTISSTGFQVLSLSTDNNKQMESVYISFESVKSYLKEVEDILLKAEVFLRAKPKFVGEK